MAEKKFSELPSAASLTGNELAALSQTQSGSLASVKSTLQAIANWFAVYAQYTTALQTTDKSIAGAINELKQLISLIPQFSIEVVEELPTEDISDTTIYLVPAEDPEIGNYYEEYIYVNNTWELVGTTDVDLSAYYTKLEVDGLLATKASVTEVALKENKSDMPTDVRKIIKDCKTPKNATITNGIAQFECIEENLVKGLKVTMNPIQDLHGYSNPWAEGAGKNKFNDTIGTHTINANTDVTLLIGSVDLVAGTTYTISCKQTPNTVTWVRNLLAIRKRGTTSIIYNSLGSGDTIRPMTYTPSDTATFDILVLGHTLSDDTTYSDFQVELGNQATDFVPYSNICPISGRTEASVKRTGKNQCYQVLNGLLSTTATNAIYYTNNDCRSLLFNCKAGTTYIASGVTANRCIWGVFDSVPNSGDSAIDFQNLGNSLVAFTPTKDGVCILYVSNFPVDTSNAQVELGSTATAYEPYTAETKTHQYSETIYGGVDDFVSGKLVVTEGYKDLGTLTWTKHSDVGRFYAHLSAEDNAKPSASATVAGGLICSQYGDSAQTSLSNGKISIDATSIPYINIIDLTKSDLTAEQFKTAMSGVQLCYELATPTTIETSAEEITTVSGTNIISGTEPISECKYTELATVDDLIKIIGGQ